MARSSSTGVSLRLAYLCNVYPAVSHSFVRREIEAVERAGHKVARFTVRPPASNLRDEADLREAAQTESVLGKGMSRLLLSALALFFSRPAKTITALAAASRLSGPGLKAKGRHVAYWLEAAWLVRRLSQLKIEHLHVHFGTNPTAVAAIVRAWGGPPFSFTAHGPDEFDAPIALSLGAKIEAASFVAAISSFGRSQLMRWTDAAHWDKIEVVRCGLGRDFLEEAAVPVPADSAEFVCIARLSAQKGLSLLIAACARLRETGEKFLVTIIGEGELRPALEAQIRESGLSDCIRLTGVQSSSEIREHLARARAFVLPSFAEGLPVVLMEALALSRPVITTAIAGIPELVQPDCGWLVVPGSEHALAEAMREALRARPDELAMKAKIGRERVRRMHDADRSAGLLIEAVERRSSPVICTQ
jgi:colanic acid/amylovoran biosynthesis glycosyltransferase